MRQAIHKIHIYALKLCFMRHINSTNRLVCRMNSPQPLELVVFKALNTDTQTVNTCRSIRAVFAGFGAAWITFKRNFAGLRERQPTRDAV